MLKTAVAEREAAARSSIGATEIKPVAPRAVGNAPMESAIQMAQAERGMTVDEFAGPVGIERPEPDSPRATVFDVGPPTDKPVDATAMLQALHFDPEGATQLREGLRRPWKAYWAREVRQDVGVATSNRFHGIDPHNNAADAFRHTLWSYKMTRLYGAEIAKAFGDGHEISRPNQIGERLMD